MTEVPKSEVVRTAGPRQARKLEGGRLVLVVVLVVYVLLFIAFNTHRVEVNFVFFTIRSQLLIAFGIIAILSFGAGFFVHARVASGQGGFMNRSSKNR